MRDAVNAFELPQPRRGTRATENRLNIARPFFGGEFVASIAFSDSFDAAIDFDGLDHGGLGLAGWAGHIVIPNNSAPVKKRTRKNLPRKIKTIPPFRGVFFG